MDEARFQLLDRLFDYHRAEMARFRRWISFFPKIHAERWEERLASDPEAALVEAGVWDVLRRNADLVEPFESPSLGGPDFRCTCGHASYYVEVTSLKIESVTRETSLPHSPQDGQGMRGFRPLTRMFRNVASSKSSQIAKATDLPCLLAIGTVHFQASCLCFNDGFAESVLTSDTMITATIDTRTGAPVGETYLSTDLSRSAFIKKGTTGSQLIEPTRQVIAGLLLCGVGCLPANVVGVLHACAVRPFDRRLLPSIRFWQLRHGYDRGEMNVDRI